MSLIIRWILMTLAIIITAYIIPGVAVDGVFAAFVAALALGLINTFIKPLIHILALPITVITLGIFALVINAGCILLIDWIVPGFTVASFWWALLFSIILSIINWALFTICGQRK